MLSDFHVLYIITKLELGGAQKVCLSLFKAFNQRNERSTLISGTNGPLVDEALKIGTVELIPEFVREVGLKGLWCDLKVFFLLIKKIRALGKKHKNLIVHTHSSKAGLMGRWAAWMAGCNNIVHTVHGFSFNDRQPIYVRWAGVLLEWFTSLITTSFVCVSLCDRELGCRLFPWFNRKSTIIRAAVDEFKFKLASKSKKVMVKKEILIGSIGCFKPQKNLFDLLKAFEELRGRVQSFKNVRLQILGDGVLRDDLEHWICKHGLSDCVDLPGWRYDVEKWLASWDVFAMSSLWEGLPCAVVEACLSRLPVVAYDVGGIREVIRNGENGFLIKPGDWNDLSEKLFDISVRDENRIALATSKNGEFSEFYLDSMIKKHEKLYKSMCR